jgi:hypothetical protein
MNKLGIDFEDTSGGNELGLDAMGRSTKRHERTGKLHYELLAIEKGFVQEMVSLRNAA